MNNMNVRDLFIKYNPVRSLFSKFGVTNAQDLAGSVFKNLKTIKTPESFVAGLLKSKSLNPRLADLSEIMQYDRLSNCCLPYEYYDDEYEYYQTKRAYGFVLEVATLTGVSDNTDELLKSLFQIGLPDGTCVQYLLHASPDMDNKFAAWKNIRNSNAFYHHIMDHRIKFLKSGSHKKLFNSQKIIVRDFRLFLSLTFDGACDNGKVVAQYKNSVSSVLKSIGIATKKIEPEELINIVRSIMCVTQNGQEHRTYDENTPIRDQISDPDNNIYIDQDGVVINDTSIVSMAVRKYPSEPKLPLMNNLVGDMMQAMMQISYPFIFCQNIQILNSEKTNGYVTVESARVEKQSKNGMGRILPIIDKKNQEYQLMKQLVSEGEGFVNMGHYLHLFTPLGESEEAVQEATSVFRSRAWELVRNKNIQLPTILSSLPLFHDPISAEEQNEFRMMRMYSQTNAVNTIPLMADYTGTNTPILQLIGRRGQLQYFDLFDNPSGNYNFSIVAASGAGKSFLANEIAFSYLSTNSRLRIIDVGYSYKNLCDLFEGQFIEFSETSKINVNPFSMVAEETGSDIKDLSESEFLQNEELKNQVEMLKSIVKTAANAAVDDKMLDSFIEKAVIDALRKQGNDATFTTVYHILNEHPDSRAKDLATSIQSYTATGLHGQYFEGKSNLDFTNDMVVLELEELNQKGQLQEVVMMILMLKISQEQYLSDRSKRSICLIDEGWALLQGNSGRFIETGYRRARKYNAAYGTCTQSVDDYDKNPTAKACWNNADWRFLLRQGSKPKSVEFDEVTSRLLFSVTTERGVYSEVLVQMGGVNCGISRLIVDPFSSFVYSSNANDVRFVNNVKKYDRLETKDSIERVLSLRDKINRITKIAVGDISAMINEGSLRHGYENYISDLFYNYLFNLTKKNNQLVDNDEQIVAILMELVIQFSVTNNYLLKVERDGVIEEVVNQKLALEAMVDELLELEIVDFIAFVDKYSNKPKIAA